MKKNINQNSFLKNQKSLSLSLSLSDDDTERPQCIRSKDCIDNEKKCETVERSKDEEKEEGEQRWWNCE